MSDLLSGDGVHGLVWLSPAIRAIVEPVATAGFAVSSRLRCRSPARWRLRVQRQSLLATRGERVAAETA